jgi:chromosomal replication initiator protein
MQYKMPGSEQEIVVALREGLAERIGRDRFDLWFGSRVQWEVHGNTVLVTAPNPFLLDHLRRQFAPDIQFAVHTVCGIPARAEFRVEALPAPAVGPDDSTSTPPATPGPAAPEPVTPPPPVAASPEPARDAEPAMRRRAALATFITGAGNRVAFTAVQSVIARPGAASPLMLYGPPGSGKSHLLEAVCAAARSGNRGIRALFLSAEQFTCHFLEALQGRGLPSFRRKCREVDLLAIDDIHFLAGKKATLIEFQHTLDALARRNRQLVVTADRAPAELSPLGSELVTRLTGGLVCSLECADFETRLGIARQFASEGTPPIPDDVIYWIASETSGDARQIRGALNRLRATSDALNEPIGMEMARKALPDILATTQRLVRLTDVERAVCDVFGMDARSLRENSRVKAISQPRMLAMWLARKYTQAAFSEIGEYFGRRSHSTVISAERKVNDWVAQGTRLRLGQSSWTVDEALRRIEMKLRVG